MEVGQKMMRVDDGALGEVKKTERGKVVTYMDRGSERHAARGEEWVPVDDFRRPLLREETLLVALTADRTLRAIERNEPDRFWEKLDPLGERHDPGLVQVITEYLSQRR